MLSSIALHNKANETIQQQLVTSLINSIAQHELEQGEALPSINELSNHLAISRDTVFKAYRELKRQGYVNATAAKGYFVTHQQNKILLLLDYYSPFKDQFHQALLKGLTKEYTVDIFFHHYNNNLFESVLRNNNGKYNFYVVMNPDTTNFGLHKSLKKIEPSKLLLIDIPVLQKEVNNGVNFSFVGQDFDQAVFNCLQKINRVIRKYSAFNLVYTDKLRHPKVSALAFERFCKSTHIPYKILNNSNKLKIQRNHAYFVVSQDDLVIVLEQCRKMKLKPGKDIGILAYNDSPLYEYVENGICVISTNFAEMGKKVAEIIKTKKTVKIVIPTKAILRGSL